MRYLLLLLLFDLSGRKYCYTVLSWPTVENPCLDNYSGLKTLMYNHRSLWLNSSWNWKADTLCICVRWLPRMVWWTICALFKNCDSNTNMIFHNGMSTHIIPTKRSFPEHSQCRFWYMYFTISSVINLGVPDTALCYVSIDM